MSRCSLFQPPGLTSPQKNATTGAPSRTGRRRPHACRLTPPTRRPRRRRSRLPGPGSARRRSNTCFRSSCFRGASRPPSSPRGHLPTYVGLARRCKLLKTYARVDDCACYMEATMHGWRNRWFAGSGATTPVIRPPRPAPPTEFARRVVAFSCAAHACAQTWPPQRFCWNLPRRMSADV